MSCTNNTARKSVPKCGHTIKVIKGFLIFREKWCAKRRDKNNEKFQLVSHFICHSITTNWAWQNGASMYVPMGCNLAFKATNQNQSWIYSAWCCRKVILSITNHSCKTRFDPKRFLITPIPILSWGIDKNKHCVINILH